MPESPTPFPELGLPVASLLALRQAVETELGPDNAARALQQAGHAAGDAVFAALSSEIAPDGSTLDQIPESQFWFRLGDFFARRGWGRLAFEAAHPGLGALESADWAEADPAAGALRPSCHFTTGLLANLLGRTVGQDVGALEVECRSRGDLRCRFVFGGQPALERLFEALRAGQDVETALAELVT